MAKDAKDAKEARDVNPKKKKPGDIKALTVLEQFLLRSSMYVGSLEKLPLEELVPTTKGPRVINTTFPPALFKIVEEIVANARDASLGDPNAKNIDIEILPQSGQITVYSKTLFPIKWIGEDVSVAVAFTKFFTSSNYDDSQESFALGQNGVGQKATVALSDLVTVETNDPDSKQKFVLIVKDNLSKIVRSKVSPSKSTQQFVKVVFTPSYKAKFGVDLPLSQDYVDYIGTLAFNASVTTPEWTKVTLNGEKIGVKSVSSYAKLLLGDASNKIAHDSVEVGNDVVFDIAVTILPDIDSSSAKGVNKIFVNGSPTSAGTVHDMVFRKLAEILSSKKITVTPTVLKSSTILIGSALIKNARFDSQSKDKVVTKPGFTWTPSDAFQRAIVKAAGDLLQYLKNAGDAKEDKKAEKALASASRLNIPNYDAALGKGASLFVAEGLSARGFVIAGRAGMPDGFKRVGVYSLKGKPKNVGFVDNGSKLKDIVTNKELFDLLKILGIDAGKTYTTETAAKLPYNHLVLATDADDDGSHIAALIMLFVFRVAPSLLSVFPDFIQIFSTPVVAVTSGPHAGKEFYSINEFDAFIAANENAKSATSKYYKGLGAWSPKEAKRLFRAYDANTTSVLWTGKPSEDALRLAFDSKLVGNGSEKKDIYVEARKDFLLHKFDPNAFIDWSVASIKMEDFIHVKMMAFSNADNLRSIPSAVDGLKRSQQKILYHALTAPSGELNVARFAAAVATKTSYHHGEASLQGAVTKMASEFAGSGNIKFLNPNGQFGTRHAQGDDAASPRYVHTSVNAVAKALFPIPDLAVLPREIDDDQKAIEPSFFTPVIATALLNGSRGVGTGWSSLVPSYNPLDLLAVARFLARGEENLARDYELLPWAIGWTGDVLSTDGGFCTHGVFELVTPRRLRITELPLGVATDSWLNGIVTPLKKPAKDQVDPATLIAEVIKKNGNDTVNVTIVLTEDVKKKDVPKLFRLVNKVSTRNMNLLDEDKKVKFFKTPFDIVKYHSTVRLAFYEKSRIEQIRVAEEEASILGAKAKYIQLIVDKALILSDFTSSQLDGQLSSLGLRKVDNSYTFLKSIPTGQLTRDNIDKLKKTIADNKAKISGLKKKSPSEMWLQDLDVFEQALSKYNENRIKGSVDDGETEREGVGVAEVGEVGEGSGGKGKRVKAAVPNPKKKKPKLG